MARYFAKAYGPTVVVMIGFITVCIITGRGLAWDWPTFVSFLCFYFAAWTLGDVLVDIRMRQRSRSSR